MEKSNPAARRPLKSPLPLSPGDRACTRRRHRRRHLSRVSTVRRRRRSPVPRLSPVHCPKDVRSTNVVLSWTPGGSRRGPAVIVFPPCSKCPDGSVYRCFASEACAAPSSSEILALQHRRGRRPVGLLVICVSGRLKCPSDPCKGASRRQACAPSSSRLALQASSWPRGAVSARLYDAICGDTEL